MSDGLTIAKLLRAREILDAQSVPAPNMYFDCRTSQWFRREGDKWVEIPEVDLQPNLFEEDGA